MNYSRAIRFCKRNELSDEATKELVSIIEDLQMQTIDAIKARVTK